MRRNNLLRERTATSIVLSRLLTKLIAHGQRDVLIETKVVLAFDPVRQHAYFIRIAKGNPRRSRFQITPLDSRNVQERFLRTGKRQHVRPPIGQGLPIRSAEDELLAVVFGLDDVRRTETVIDIDRTIPPTEIDVEPAIGRQCHAYSRRSLPIPIGVAFGRPSSIIDLRDTRRIPPRERHRKINRSLAAGNMSSFSQCIERSVFEKPTCLQRTTSPFCRDVDHATHSIGPPKRALGAPNDFNFFDVVNGEVGKIERSRGRTIDNRSINQDQRLTGVSTSNPYVCHAARSAVLERGHARRKTQHFQQRLDLSSREILFGQDLNGTRDLTKGNRRFGGTHDHGIKRPDV